MASTTTSASGTAAASPADAWLDAVGRHDIEAAVAVWAPGGVLRLAGGTPHAAPDGVREVVRSLLRAVPDLSLEVVERVVDGERAAYRVVASGTFAGDALAGLQATGARAQVDAAVVVRTTGGLVAESDVVVDGLGALRALGIVPGASSPAARRARRAVNRRTRIARVVAGTGPEQVADGVWLIRGGFPARTMNVYLVRDGAGVLVFDGGVHTMTRALAIAGAQLGGITRVVVSHSHADHRGAVPGLGDVPVLVHEDERVDAEGDGGAHYMHLSELDPHGRVLMPRLLRSWDGGPVRVTGTLREGDEVAGFRVVHLPGHAPGLIALWRETDRIALVSDAFYTLDPQSGRKGPARVPHRAFNRDTEQARASLRKLAALEPFAAFPGHADAVKGDVRAQLERAADTT